MKIQLTVSQWTQLQHVKPQLVCRMTVPLQAQEEK